MLHIYITKVYILCRLSNICSFITSVEQTG